MTAKPDTISDARHGKIGGTKVEEHQVEFISLLDERAEPRRQ